MADSFLNKAADQLLTIGLLFLVAYILWKRLSHVEDKLGKYLDEDRKEMLNVIKENSDAMKELKDAIIRRN